MSPTTSYSDVDPTADWSVLSGYVQEKCRLAANSVASTTSAQTLMDADDLYQEALVICATNAERVRGYLSAGEMGHLYTWLRNLVMNTVRTEVSRSSKSISYEVAAETWASWE